MRGKGRIKYAAFFFYIDATVGEKGIQNCDGSYRNILRRRLTYGTFNLMFPPNGIYQSDQAHRSETCAITTATELLLVLTK